LASPTIVVQTGPRRQQSPAQKVKTFDPGELESRQLHSPTEAETAYRTDQNPTERIARSLKLPSNAGDPMCAAKEKPGSRQAFLYYLNTCSACNYGCTLSAVRRMH
jgi:hypothetical protein